MCADLMGDWAKTGVNPLRMLIVAKFDAEQGTLYLKQQSREVLLIATEAKQENLASQHTLETKL